MCICWCMSIITNTMNWMNNIRLLVLFCCSFSVPYLSGLTSPYSVHLLCPAKWRFLQWFVICPSVHTCVSPRTHGTQFSDMCWRWTVFPDKWWQLDLSGGTAGPAAVLGNSPGTEVWHSAQCQIPGQQLAYSELAVPTWEPDTVRSRTLTGEIQQ